MKQPEPPDFDQALRDLPPNERMLVVLQLAQRLQERVASRDYRDRHLPRYEDDGAYDFLLFLTHEEFSLCYTLVTRWQHQRGDEWSLSPHLGLGEAFRAVIHKIHEDYGYEFKGLNLEQSPDTLFARVGEAVTPNNALYPAMLAVGRKPDYLVHCDRAIEFVQTDESLSTLLDGLLDLRREIRDHLSKMPEPSEEEKEILKWQEKIRRESMEALSKTIH